MGIRRKLGTVAAFGTANSQVWHTEPIAAPAEKGAIDTRSPGCPLGSLLQANEPLPASVSWGALLRVGVRGPLGACPILTVPALVLGKRKGMDVIHTVFRALSILHSAKGWCLHKLQEASVQHAACHFLRARSSPCLSPFRLPTVGRPTLS